ncbi:hypothetical protein GCM10008967_37190 [Bacillus carboniphilus]|uniref:Uncharacterized protein n=1 Tax=Bacillus carboniphilus TaxID=86663 RepID=A0ABN0WPB3_9BACI
MNANGMARGYMAKGMNEEQFLQHVLYCMETELMEREENLAIWHRWTSNRKQCQLGFVLKGELFMFDLNREIIRSLQKRSPYALDRFLWTELLKYEITVQDDHYLRTVFR